ncbi:MAG: hypothetical protein WD009_13920 [Phycisphaeraceae bacterium]
MALTQRPPHAMVHALLSRHGRTFAEDLHLDLGEDDASPPFRLLCFALLVSMKLHHHIALDAAEAMRQAGWTTPQRMADAGWRRRVRLLNRAGCARCDERAATALGDLAHALVADYTGDLRGLRDAADRDPARERRLLEALPGVMGPAVDVFFREVQIVWDELYPYADRLALRGADWLGLPADASRLATLMDDRRQMVRFVAALVRMELEYDLEEVRRAAR